MQNILSSLKPHIIFFSIIVSSFFLSIVVVARDVGSIQEIEQSPPPINLFRLNIIWEFLKEKTRAPTDFPPPPIVIDWEVPIIARMGFQYPTEEFPNNRLQISVAPRTVDMYSWELVLFGIGHEFAHYLFLMRDNEWNREKPTFITGRPHHCNPEFKAITKMMADRIWDINHSTDNRRKMYAEVQRSCANFPKQ